MRYIKVLIVLSVIAFPAWFVWSKNLKIKDWVGGYVENGEILTLEAHFTPEKIMEQNRQDLLIDDSHQFLEPQLKFHPYLLMEVKYIQPDKKSKEGIILWSMVDGEMVLDAETWEKTHGFQDAINANATYTDFKILNILAQNGGTYTKEEIQNELNVKPETLDSWIENARQKHLVATRDNEVKLHFENPKIDVPPQTKIKQWLVTKPYSHAQKIPINYSEKEIEKVSNSAFGEDFAIRNAKTVFLPVYKIVIKNPDQSSTISYWNAVNGQRITQQYLK